ncbi:MAG: hypothetical protein EXR95_04955 [Gemmatimonadetes bacterium]|nr:hypothetical protein [Gemmatimonadota bacterium]
MRPTGRPIARLQLLTVAELLAGATVDQPRTAGLDKTYKQAPRQVQKVAEQLGLDDLGAISAPDPTTRKTKGKKSVPLPLN